MNKKIIVVDGQGGGIGKSVVEKLRQALPACFIIAVGTNALATSNMLKAGANVGATGENAVIYNANHGDILVGPIGIVFANAMYGEISPKMALAIQESEIKKFLIPVSKCPATIVGIENKSIGEYVDQCVQEILKLAS